MTTCFICQGSGRVLTTDGEPADCIACHGCGIICYLCNPELSPRNEAKP